MEKNNLFTKEHLLVVGVFLLLIVSGLILLNFGNNSNFSEKKINKIVTIEKELNNLKRELVQIKAKKELDSNEIKTVLNKIDLLEKNVTDANIKEKLKKIKEILTKQKKDISEAINIIDSILNETNTQKKNIEDYKSLIDEVINYLNRNSEALSGKNLTFSLEKIDVVPNYLVLYLKYTDNKKVNGKIIILRSLKNKTILIGNILPISQLNITGNSADEIIENFIKKSTQGKNLSAKILNRSENNGLYVYLVNISINNKSQILPLTVTEDGRYILFMVRPLDLTKDLPKPKPYEPPKQKPIPKTDRPTVELFVMSHCPFGLQMEKAMLPVIDLLKDKVNFTIKFVDYSMHGPSEVRENLLQYCLEKINKTEYFKYLKCYVASGNTTECLNKTNFNMNIVEKCINETDKKYNVTYNLEHKTGYFPKFLVNEKDNIKYNVQGSPTTIINGVEYVGNRSPEAIKEAICNAFTNPPKECNVNLSTEWATPGFGYGTSNNGASYSCGA